jgi:hypothetical protein
MNSVVLILASILFLSIVNFIKFKNKNVNCVISTLVVIVISGVMVFEVEGIRDERILTELFTWIDINETKSIDWLLLTGKGSVLSISILFISFITIISSKSEFKKLSIYLLLLILTVSTLLSGTIVVYFVNLSLLSFFFYFLYLSALGTQNINQKEFSSKLIQNLSVDFVLIAVSLFVYYELEAITLPIEEQATSNSTNSSVLVLLLLLLSLFKVLQITGLTLYRQLKNEDTDGMFWFKAVVIPLVYFSFFTKVFSAVQLSSNVGFLFITVFLIIFAFNSHNIFSFKFY